MYFTLAVMIFLSFGGTKVWAQALLNNVGALTPFNQANSLALSTYCDGSDAVDDLTCLTNWVRDADAQGKDLWADVAGTYLHSNNIAIFHESNHLRSSWHLKCVSTDVVFKRIGNIGQFLVLAADFGSQLLEPWNDFSIENCGFDMNGTTANFAGVVSLVGNTQFMHHVTIRGNRVFDSTQPGSMFTSPSSQRQYVFVGKATDVLVENNVFSEGGRIKVGAPGNRFVIRNNSLHNINDNAITVVIGQPDITPEVDIIIENNLVQYAIGSTIFFGSDGQSEGLPESLMSDIIIRNNTLIGDMKVGCITGTLFENAYRVLIENNYCYKTSNTGTAAYGILMTRADNITLDARSITIRNNRIDTATSTNFTDSNGIYIASHFANLCIFNNTLGHSGAGLGIRLFSHITSGKVTGNTLNGGSVAVGGSSSVDQSGNKDGCFIASRGVHRLRR